MKTYICQTCGKTYLKKQAYVAHMRSHTNYKQPKRVKCCSLLTRQEISVEFLDKHEASYIKHLKICKTCGQQFHSEENNAKFCSHSCSCAFNNNLKSKAGFYKNLVIKRKKLKDKKLKEDKKYPSTRIYKHICKKTGKIFYSKYRVDKFHPSVYDIKEKYYRDSSFKFGVSLFPLWFDLEKIKEYGWYSTPGSRHGIKNLNGISRDHLISRKFGFEHDIDPLLLAHPANCELIPHKENQHKNSKCKITEEELKERIKKFELLYPNWN